MPGDLGAGAIHLLNGSTTPRWTTGPWCDRRPAGSRVLGATTSRSRPRLAVQDVANEYVHVLADPAQAGTCSTGHSVSRRPSGR